MKCISLAGRSIVVTGGTQGIGAEVARDAARAGAGGICIAGRNAANGRAIVAELEALGCKAIFVAADLASAAATAAIMPAAVAALGHVDGLVNAAGITDRGHIEDTSIELWDRMMAVNVRAPFILTQALVRHLKSSGQARQRRQHHHAVVARRPAVSHCIRDLEGRAGDADQEQRARAAQ